MARKMTMAIIAIGVISLLSIFVLASALAQTKSSEDQAKHVTAATFAKATSDDTAISAETVTSEQPGSKGDGDTDADDSTEATATTGQGENEAVTTTGDGDSDGDDTAVVTTTTGDGDNDADDALATPVNSD